MLSYHLKEQFLLRPDIVFLNHGSFGACPRPVFETYQDWQRRLEAQPVEFLGREVTGLLRAARSRLAGYLNAAADDLVFVHNATTGVNIVARSLHLQPGDEVLATNHEYGAMDRTWRYLCERQGATYVNQALPLPVAEPQEVVETLWARVSPRTRVIFLSHITSPTALIMPLKAICRRAREAGILTIVDGAHAPGQIPVDLQDLDPDFYSGNCHKWLCAPKGAGFLYVRAAQQHLVEPLVVSWGWQSETPGTSRFVDLLEWQGTDDMSAYLTVPAAIDFQAAHDWDAVRGRCHALLQEARRRIEDLSGLPPICPDSPAWYAQMAALPLPACDAQALKRRLYDEQRVEVPIIEWGGRQFVRVSVQGYNSSADLDALVDALKTVL